MEEFKLIIAGGRNFDNYGLLKEKTDRLLSEKVGNFEIVIVSGMAKGADMLGERYAAEKGYEVAEFEADWSMGGKAGPIRNQQMVSFADGCICFWNGYSRGTKNMIDLAQAKGIPVRVISY